MDAYLIAIIQLFHWANSFRLHRNSPSSLFRAYAFPIAIGLNWSIASLCEVLRRSRLWEHDERALHIAVCTPKWTPLTRHAIHTRRALLLRLLREMAGTKWKRRTNACHRQFSHWSRAVKSIRQYVLKFITFCLWKNEKILILGDVEHVRDARHNGQITCGGCVNESENKRKTKRFNCNRRIWCIWCCYINWGTSEVSSNSLQSNQCWGSLLASPPGCRPHSVDAQ